MSDSEVEIVGLSKNGFIKGVRYTSSASHNIYLDSDADFEDDDKVEFIVKKPNKRKVPDVYTVEDAVERIGFGPFQIVVTIFTGVIWLSDAMEVMLLAVLSPIVKCEWDLTSWQQAMITSVVFVGFFFGGLTWGFMTDAVGRRTTLLIIDFIILGFGLISALSPSYYWLLFFRFIAGFGIGGSSQAVTYYVEFLPLKMRGVCIVLQEVWWAIGSILAALLALGVVPNLPEPLNWRVYLSLCAVPIGLVLVFFLFMPESARYYVSKGQIEKGEEVIKRIAWFNRRPPPSGRLVSQEEKERLENEDETELQIEESSLIENENTQDGVTQEEEEEPLLVGDSASCPSPSSVNITLQENRIEKFTRKMILAFKQFGKDLASLFSKKMRRTTVLLLFIWLGCAWLYYGAVLLTTTILEKGYDPRCPEPNETNETSNETGNGDCNLSTSFYVKIVWTSAAEFPGIIITLVIIELIGRRITMAIEFICTGVFIGLLLICVPETYLTLFLFGARGFATGVFQAVYVYTPEVYPTKFRGSSVGLMTSAARIGSLITPFIAQTLFHVNAVVTILLYVSSCLVLMVLALLLPIETKGRSLKDLQ